MNTIPEIKNWPNEATVESIQGKIAKSYEYRTVGTANGQKTVQNAELVDAAGNKVRLGVWEHPDLKPLEGKEVVLHSNKSGNGRFGGVSVKIGTYTNKKGESVPTFELSVSKLGTFQLVEVFNAQNGGGVAQPSTPASEPVKTQGTPVSGAPAGQVYKDPKADGQRSGMCFKLAGDYVIASRHPDMGPDDFVVAVKDLAIKLIAASKEMEANA